MTLYQFRALDPDAQADIVWRGTFLDGRTEGKRNILLYAVDNFYVEVHYSSASLNTIENLVPFRSTTPLLPYLNQLDSSEIHSLL